MKAPNIYNGVIPENHQSQNCQKMANGFIEVCLTALKSLMDEQRQLAMLTGHSERRYKCTSILDKLSVQSENALSFLPKCAAVWADIQDLGLRITPIFNFSCSIPLKMIFSCIPT